MAKLEELRPQLSDAGSTFQTLYFLCPLCRQRMVAVDIWGGTAGDIEIEPGKVVRLWHAKPGPHRDFASLSITPSIDAVHSTPAANGCKGWHGFVTNGEAR